MAGNWIHPNEPGDDQVNQYLTHLAVDREVAARTQNQALSALLFLYTKVLDFNLNFEAVRAKRPERLPVVLSAGEIARLLCQIPPGTNRLMAGIMYGAGLRVLECCRLRIKDVDLDRRQIIIRDGKGEKVWETDVPWSRPRSLTGMGPNLDPRANVGQGKTDNQCHTLNLRQKTKLAFTCIMFRLGRGGKKRILVLVAHRFKNRCHPKAKNES